jgi:hypothetical protein
MVKRMRMEEERGAGRGYRVAERVATMADEVGSE